MRLAPDLATRLQQARTQAGLSPSVVAAQLGIGRSELQDYESGDVLPGPLLLADLAGLLGCSVDSFYDHEERPYRVVRTPSKPAQMRDHLAAEEEQRAAQRKHLNELRDWFQHNQAKPGALVTREGRDAVQRLAELGRKLEGQTTVPPAILAWLDLEQPA
jgi:transcriptional regulator with XRE-family HTH domain